MDYIITAMLENNVIRKQKVTLRNGKGLRKGKDVEAYERRVSSRFMFLGVA
jgi:hypothetical protein